jgi:hypothetical protein
MGHGGFMMDGHASASGPRGKLTAVQVQCLPPPSPNLPLHRHGGPFPPTPGLTSTGTRAIAVSNWLAARATAA